MIVWLDNHAFPPSAEVEDAARAAGAALIISQPWPRDYAGMTEGENEIPEPVYVEPEPDVV